MWQYCQHCPCKARGCCFGVRNEAVDEDVPCRLFEYVAIVTEPLPWRMIRVLPQQHTHKKKIQYLIQDLALNCGETFINTSNMFIVQLLPVNYFSTKLWIGGVRNCTGSDLNDVRWDDQNPIVSHLELDMAMLLNEQIANLLPTTLKRLTLSQIHNLLSNKLVNCLSSIYFFASNDVEIWNIFLFVKHMLAKNASKSNSKMENLEI